MQPEQMPVDRPIDQHAQFGAQRQFGRPPSRPMKGTVDRAVDRLARSKFLLRVGQLFGRPKEGSVDRAVDRQTGLLVLLGFELCFWSVESNYGFLNI